MKHLCRIPGFIARRKDGLTFKLFSFLTIILISILTLQGVAEKALMKALLKVPEQVKSEMLSLAQQANVLIEEGNMYELADWANAQPYYLFVIDSHNKPVTHRDMHPHFEFKLRYLRNLDHQLDARVNQPIFGIDLNEGRTLVIQLPYQVHPAQYFPLYFSLIKALIALVILTLFSLIMARGLQQPLDRLREASRRLAQGDFSVSVVAELNSSTREFNELAVDFDHMTNEIHSLAEKQNRLIRDVSHELRTPLARQNLALHLLRNKIPEDDQHFLDRLETETEEMNKLVGEILEFSRLENSRYNTQLSPIQLEQYCAMQVDQNKRDLKPNQTLNTNFDESTSQVKGDERLVLRIINNLVGNAIKYAGDSAEIKVSSYEIHTVDSDVKDKPSGTLNLDCEPKHKGCYVVVAIEDDGFGIPESQLDRIFDPFTRLESARDKQSGGYGLGLAIVKEAMLLMKGRVIAENRSEGGLRVSLWFPIN